jgi:hypothetical protein
MYSNMWMVKVESHREFWKCNANLLECGKCNLEFSCVPSFVPAGSGIGGESGEFTHRPQSNEIRANSRITRDSERAPLTGNIGS